MQIIKQAQNIHGCTGILRAKTD